MSLKIFEAEMTWNIYHEYLTLESWPPFFIKLISYKFKASRNVMLEKLKQISFIASKLVSGK